MGKLALSLIDVYGQPINEPIDIQLENQRLASDRHRIVHQSVTGKLNIEGLKENADGLYRILIEPFSYEPVSEFVRVTSAAETPLEIQFPADIDKVTGINVDSFSSFNTEAQRLLATSAKPPMKGEQLFGSYTDIQKAGFLNISEKAFHTRLISNKVAIQYFKKLREVKGDRFFVDVDPTLVGDTADSERAGLFRRVPDTLHAPPPGFVHAGSYKTQDLYGNLQLTFHQKDGAFVADVDIDDAAGFEHFFQVVRNAISGPTHPYNIHEILVGYQHIQPQYRLVFGHDKELTITVPG